LLADSIRGSLLLGSWPLLSACREESSQALPRQSLGDYASAMLAISFIGPTCIERSGFDAGTSDAQVISELNGALQARIDQTAPDSEIPEALDALIRSDFEAGRLVEVDGWQLSATECSLAALAAAIQGIRSPQTPQPDEVRLGTVAKIVDWGPRSTLQGKKFNEQADGHCGLWFKTEGAPASTAVLFDGVPQATQIYPDLLTSGISGQQMHEVLSHPGVYPVELLDRSRQIRQPVGEFEVVPSAASVAPGQAAACGIFTWGPTTAAAGQPFNEQPGGASAFWVKTDCAVTGAVLELDGEPLKTTLYPQKLTASVPAGHKLGPGEHPLTLLLPGGERLPVGMLRVDP